MTLNQVKQALEQVNQVVFKLPNGQLIEPHFHVTEVGQVTKKFIDCGGAVRDESVANFQLWSAHDTEHRLAPEKLLNIITISEDKLGLSPDLNVEVEYQEATIASYDLSFDSGQFVLLAKRTDCLAKDKCGIPPLSEISTRAELSKLSLPSFTLNK